MCSSIIEKYINRHNQYESLSIAKFCFLYNIKKNKTSKHCKPKIIRFVNYNKYKNIKNWLKRKTFIVSIISKFKKLPT
jgi:hypothetical protein